MSGIVRSSLVALLASWVFLSDGIKYSYEVNDVFPLLIKDTVRNLSFVLQGVRERELIGTIRERIQREMLMDGRLAFDGRWLRDEDDLFSAGISLQEQELGAGPPTLALVPPFSPLVVVQALGPEGTSYGLLGAEPGETLGALQERLAAWARMPPEEVRMASERAPFVPLSENCTVEALFADSPAPELRLLLLVSGAGNHSLEVRTVREPPAETSSHQNADAQNADAQNADAEAGDEEGRGGEEGEEDAAAPSHAVFAGAAPYDPSGGLAQNLDTFLIRTNRPMLTLAALKSRLAPPSTSPRIYLRGALLAEDAAFEFPLDTGDDRVLSVVAAPRRGGNKTLWLAVGSNYEFSLQFQVEPTDRALFLKLLLKERLDNPYWIDFDRMTMIHQGRTLEDDSDISGIPSGGFIRLISWEERRTSRV